MSAVPARWRAMETRFVWRTVLRVAAIAAAGAGVVVFVVAPLTGHFTGRFEDFNAYFGAAQATLNHADIYSSFTSQSQDVALRGFDYPPIVALLVTPLAFLPKPGAATAWLLIELGATAAGCLIVARTLLPAAWPRTELAALATVLYGPATINLWHGQMNPLVFLLLAVAAKAWVRDQPALCGVCIGWAASIKLAPVVLIVLMLRRRWWDGAALALGILLVSAAIGVLVYGVHTTLEYAQSVLPVLGRGDGWIYNQSWAGVVNRALDHSVLSFQPDLLSARIVSLGLSLAGIAAAAWCVRPARTDAGIRGAQFAAGVVAMLLAGTITWYAHDVHLLIALAGAAAFATGVTAGRSMLQAAILVCALCTAVLAPWLIASASMPLLVSLSTTGWWWPLLQAASLPALSAALLLAAIVNAVRGAGRGTRGTSLPSTPARRAVVRAA